MEIVNKVDKHNLNAIDVMKYVAAILVIGVHTAPLLPFSKLGNFVVSNILGRLVVPFFFLSSGYFVCKLVQRKGAAGFKSYLIKLIKIYLFWSILYIPCGIEWLQQNLTELPVILYPIALLIAVFYVGTFYPLWFLPALIGALVIVYWLQSRFRMRYILIAAILLLGFGALETYYGVLPDSWIRSLFTSYIDIFITSRNAVFFGLCYVAFGFYLAQKKRKLALQHPGYWSIFFLILTFVEAFMLYGTDSLNFNILLMVLPFTICFFEYLKNVDLQWDLNYQNLRAYSGLYFYLHGFFLVIIPLILRAWNMEHLYLENGMFRFFSVMIVTHLLSSSVLKIKKYQIIDSMISLCIQVALALKQFFRSAVQWFLKV